MMMIMMIEKSNEILLERELYRVGNDRRSNGKMIMIMIMIFVGRMIFSAISTIWVLITVPNTYYERPEELTLIAARTVDHVHVGIVQTYETNGPKNKK